MEAAIGRLSGSTLAGVMENAALRQVSFVGRREGIWTRNELTNSSGGLLQSGNGPEASESLWSERHAAASFSVTARSTIRCRDAVQNLSGEHRA
jgi:hypothetical protein